MDRGKPAKLSNHLPNDGDWSAMNLEGAEPHVAWQGKSDALVLGIDVGSTTVKTVAVDPVTREILWSDYRRHEARQAATPALQLPALEARFRQTPVTAMRAFVTGSGGMSLAASLGAKFVQEVNAVTVAVDALHPDVGSVIELGGQDAKVIIYEPTQRSDRRVIASMNDKCASGTSATIDKCVIKVGLPGEPMSALSWDPTKLHPVPAKCGGFAKIPCRTDRLPTFGLP